MNHAVESPIAPCSPFITTSCGLPSSLVGAPVELSPPNLGNGQVKLQLEDSLADWSLEDEFALPFPAPDIHEDQCSGGNDVPAFPNNLGSGN